MKNTGAEALIKALEHLGAEYIFGYPGGAVLPLYHELRKSSLKHILTRTEQGAAHAASGYSRVSGKVGVCFATSGPGATNLVTGLATAYMDSIPIVAITGQVMTGMIGADAFQEVDITGITQPITKHNYLITHAQDIPRVIMEAFFIASSGRPGPVLVDIPKNIAEGYCALPLPADIALPGYKPTYKGHGAQIKSACLALAKAKKPLIYAGGGVISAKAWSELRQLAEKINCPVATTLMSKGCMPHNHRLYLGMLGIHGFPAAGAAIRECDVLLALGARFSDRVMEADGAFASKAKIIHVDIDPAEISKNINAHIPIVGDVKMVLEEMLARLEESALTAEWLEILEHYKNDNKAVYNSAGKKGLNAFKIIKSVSALAGENAIVCTDVGQHQMAAAQFFPLKRPGGFLTSGGLGTMGYGVPAAIGAQLAAPCDTVICFSGDGSLQMSFNELAVVKAHNLPLKIVLLNNSCLGLVRQLQHSYYGGRYFAVDMEGNPDFVALAAAYGIDALKINAENELDYALEKAFASPKPYLLDCAVSKEDLIFSGLTPSDKNM